MRKSKEGKRKKKDNKFILYIKQLKRKDKILLFIIILIFTFIILEEGVIRPLTDKQEALQHEMVTLNGQKMNALDAIDKQYKLREKLDDVTYKYNKALSSLPKTEEQANILNTLITISSETGIELKDITFENGHKTLNKDNSKDSSSNQELDEIDGKASDDEENSKKDDVLINSANLEVSGSFDSLLNFIKRIEGTKRKINISSLNIEKSSLDENGKMKEVLQASINIEYYNLNYKEKEKYDFNKGTYGKENYFK
ncbi:hypothetical protein [Clostridium sp.]|uniref:hypothetical protein n=1 Tax=Clostridium sp. TaxID=1506 RepID=UPI002A90DC74|nr:hypothetical protein [Clostridium sp.]MDY6012383.1 hypothetical protein [Clostridium sp.]